MEDCRRPELTTCVNFKFSSSLTATNCRPKSKVLLFTLDTKVVPTNENVYQKTARAADSLFSSRYQK